MKFLFLFIACLYQESRQESNKKDANGVNFHLVFLKGKFSLSRSSASLCFNLPYADKINCRLRAFPLPFQGFPIFFPGIPPIFYSTNFSAKKKIRRHQRARISTSHRPTLFHKPTHLHRPTSLPNAYILVSLSFHSHYFN